ncbi:hypothetical protein PRZ48_014682 [Zasmidium cellare]|uniref:Uncharacterized protein n=1 Tax=Zasmidium cellare TaxID=395010 RepID=A0ABR0DZ60_ZASCE|nr:hypothetical protein PRZ48_014682 [Zasmidium cellare]
MQSTNPFSALSKSQTPSTPSTTPNTSSTYNVGAATTLTSSELKGFQSVSYKKTSPSPSPKSKPVVYAQEQVHVFERELILKKRPARKGKVKHWAGMVF